MPLAGPSVQNFVQNRESANTNGHLPTRSSTPQPQQQRERSRQRTVQDRRQARSNSQNGLHSRETLQNLKVEVPNTLRKTVSSIPQTLVANTGRRSNAHASARPQKSRLVRLKYPRVSPFADYGKGRNLCFRRHSKYSFR